MNVSAVCSAVEHFHITLFSFLDELGGKPNDIGASLVCAMSSLIALAFCEGLKTASVSEHALKSPVQPSPTHHITSGLPLVAADKNHGSSVRLDCPEVWDKLRITWGAVFFF